MPAVSMFYGIIIYLYFLDNRRHHLPHFHAMYGELEGVFDIESGEMIEGNLPQAKVHLVRAWLEIHREDLMADWQLASSGQKIFNIEPLK